MKKDCIAVDAIDPIDSFHRKMSGIEGLSSLSQLVPQGARICTWDCQAPPEGGTLHNSRRHHLWAGCGHGVRDLPAVLQGLAKTPALISLLCAQKQANIQTSARTVHLLFRKSHTASVLSEASLFYFLLSDL